jgi:transposase
LELGFEPEARPLPANRHDLSYNDLAAELTLMKQQPATAWLREMDSQLLQQALRDLDSAYQHFFRRLRTAKSKRVSRNSSHAKPSHRASVFRNESGLMGRWFRFPSSV